MARFALAIASLLAVVLGSPASAAVHEIVLGHGGEVYRAVRGRYADLFPDAPKQQADDTVLALEIHSAGESAPTRLLVPSTQGDDVESAPFLLHEDTLDTVFIIWESRTNLIHSQVSLISYGSKGWSDVIVLTPDSWSFKSSPQIAVSTDTYKTLDVDDSPIQHRRTIVHALWWEQSGAGDRTLYSPVVLVDGAYIGWNPMQVLDELDPSDATATAALEPSLYRSPGLGAGVSPNTVVASYVNPKTGRLLNLEIEVLPWQLTEIAAQVRDKVLEIGGDGGGKLGVIADGARAHILVAGVNWFNERFVRSLANEAYSRILEIGAAKSAEDIRNLADGARAHILVAGVDLSGPVSRASRLCRTFELGLEPDGGDPFLVIQMRLAASLPAPATGAGPTTIYSSNDGVSALVAWEDGQQIRYRENQGHGWSTVHQLALTPTLDRDRAYQILEQRARNN